MLDVFKSEVGHDEKGDEIKRIEHEVVQLAKRLDNLLDKIERGLISDDDFKPRYSKIKSEINQLENEKAQLLASEKAKQSALNDLESCYDEIADFGKNWEYLDDIGKALRIKSVVKKIRATKDEIEMDIYLDVANVSHTDMDSSPPPA